MAQYYQFSLVTLAGTREDTTHGLLRPCNNMPWARLVQIPYTDKSGTQAGRLYAYKRRVPLADDYWAAVRESILFRRGWILQEWLLSKRILWYTSKGMFFECQTDGARSEYAERVLVDNAHRSQLQLKGSFHFASSSILDVWYAAIEVYSSCHLTKPEQDRILAVAGLAKEVSLILANKKCEVYLAGHWLRDIHQSLFWEEEHEAAPWAMKVDPAPSWSWASVMTPVKWPARDKDVKKAVQLVGICHTKRDSHHQIECVVDKGWTASISGRKVEFDPTNISACLHVRGKLHTVHIRGYLIDGSTAASLTGYATAPNTCRWRALCAPNRPEVVAGWVSAEGLKGNGCADVGIAVHALHVSTRYARTGVLIKHHDPVLDVLLLEEVDPHVFRRVGVGRIFDMELIRQLGAAGNRDIQLV
ncbi:hypothetical protein GE09DRAFT_980195 [Coniochaeta sp. 2T2.1]|nr:hypothetical protein GE09DRAFT_980195 [Coniochaeta sp. 2T2.1]